MPGISGRISSVFTPASTTDFSYVKFASFAAAQDLKGMPWPASLFLLGFFKTFEDDFADFVPDMMNI